MTRQVPNTKAELKELAGKAIDTYEAIEDAEAKMCGAVDDVAEVLGDLNWTSVSYQGYWIGWDVEENGDLQGPYMKRTETINLDNL